MPARQRCVLRPSVTGVSAIITRRKLLATAAGGALAAVLQVTLPTWPLGAVNLLTAYITLAGSLDERLVIWWMKGTRYGIVGARVTPLFGFQAGRFQRFFRQANGSFVLAMFELNYCGDMATGKLLEEFQNPYTGVINEVTHVAKRPIICRYNAAGQFVPADDDRIRRYRGRLGPASVNGDTVRIESSVSAQVVSPFPKTPNTQMNDHISVTGHKTDLLDPHAMWTPATLSYQNVQPWEPWMKMGNHPGYMTSRASGRKLESVAELSADYLGMARTIHPWLIRDPIETLAVQVQKIRSSYGV